jgi:acyl-coenzyme A thioesterase PaaI-like protein
MEHAALQDRLLPNNTCFGCGPANPDGLQLKSYEDGDVLVATWTPREGLNGPPNVTHGGMVAVPMDCHATWAAMMHFGRVRGDGQMAAVTAGYSVSLRAPTPIGQRIDLRGWVVEGTERKARVRVTAHARDTLTAEFEGTFVAVPPFEY